jgi:hypothetical protein
VVVGLGAVMASLALGLVIAAVFAVGEAREPALADAARHEADPGNYLARASVAARMLEDQGGGEVARFRLSDAFLFFAATRRGGHSASMQ